MQGNYTLDYVYGICEILQVRLPGVPLPENRGQFTETNDSSFSYRFFITAPLPTIIIGCQIVP